MLANIKLWFVLGTAAELIKIYPLIKKAQEKGIKWFVISTGQSGKNFWKQYEDFLLPKANAYQYFQTNNDLENSIQAMTWFTKCLFISKSNLLTQLESYFNTKIAANDLFFVHGDTLSTVIGAKWAKKLGLKLIHIEAGMRSHSIVHPFPEELNRKYVSRLCTAHMAPDEKSAMNLKNEGFTNIFNTKGNTVYDTVLMFSEDNSTVLPVEAPFVLANIHRFENINSKIRWNKIISTILEIAKHHKVVFIMHPQTEYKLLKDLNTKNRLLQAKVQLFPRLNYRVFIKMLKQSEYVVSDGGSNQEECFYLGKPCLIMREKTERFEGLNTTCILSNFDENIIHNFLTNYMQLERKPWIPKESPSEIVFNSLYQLFGIKT